MRILLVEDSRDLSEGLLERFRGEGHAIDLETDGAEAESLLRHASFDVVILDINLPSMNGYDVLRAMRARGDRTPVLVLTARSEIDDRIVGLDIGADDYMVKPFDFREISARCRALVRRRSGEASNVFVQGTFQFDRGARRASLGGIDLELRHREVQVLELFLSHLGRVLTKDEVADRIYSFDEAPSLNAVEQTMTRLRKKLDGSPIAIRTIRGLGYIASIRDA
ncbi:response regulator transcription factor [Jiella avicenniae]|uniref:Response regulator transcription factor n=1 Tax=Jiella avicenniae TaxID=2907202 RepID=A0A9X1P0E2_9HYPH|nr:response regulator transcription factor [Jiella avicenniae]MCE7027751.1 response regulator transcription factor [Jiella avicenniae]MCE7028793.1 response regulator transcription factor [Jiella avicenniae]